MTPPDHAPTRSSAPPIHTRRRFLRDGAGLGLLLAAGTTRLRAQDTAAPVVVLLRPGNPSTARQAADGFDMGLEEIERAASLLKRKVTGAGFDATPAGLAALRKLAADRPVVALVSAATGQVARDAAALVEAAGGIVFCGSLPLSERALSWMPPHDDVVALLGSWMAHRKLRAWQVVSGGEGSGEETLAAWREHAAAAGATIVAEGRLTGLDNGGGVRVPAPRDAADVTIVTATPPGADVILDRPAQSPPVVFATPGVFVQAHAGETVHPEIWHGSLRRYGATQLNSRFETRFGRPMTSTAWGHWLAVKTAWEAVVRSPGGDRQQPDPAILDRLVVDGQKGAALRFTPGGPLDQAIYLVERRTNAQGEVEAVVVDVPDRADRRRGPAGTDRGMWT